VDEPDLKIGSFTWESPDRAWAPISAGPGVAPGDYWLKMSTEFGPVEPQYGSIVIID